MVSRTKVLLTDDLTGGDADETIPFSFDGNNYVIDLNEKNAEEMRALMSKYTDVARKLKRGEAPVRPRAYTQPVIIDEDEVSWTKEDRAAMQKFADINGLKVPGERGRISSGVVSSWIAAGRPS